ncbi:tryptophan--tRNA ligase [Candidatus Saccharibacteria bacterium]|nr:tryptophan--tRNA ligase [Candidatus Saccharibacteria bacterium]
MKTILTGLRINSDLHLGHYLGVLTHMARLANEHSGDYHINYFIPDLHSIISEIDGDLEANTIRNIKYYLAAGLKVNENVHFYRQSRVPAHSELCWILNCVATMGELYRMTQYKEKSDGKTSANVGIFDYPVLMAADILLYSATYVPVGEDQFQHIELTRNLATRFNHRFGEIFTIPVETSEQVKFMGVEKPIRVRDLVNPEKKMSKSTSAENSKIMLEEDPAKATKKIMGATTDSFQEIQFDFETRPGISNLLYIEALLTEAPLSEVVEKWRGESRYGELKKQVAATVTAKLTEFQKRVAEIPDEEVAKLLEAGEEYANKVATAKLLEVQRAVGLR